MSQSNFWDNAELIYSYTREQGIADGVLVDVTAWAEKAGFRVPVAMTDRAWQACVAWAEGDTKRTRQYQNETGRLWDVLMVLHYTIHKSDCGSRVDFKVSRVCRDDGKRRAQSLYSVIGPGDNGEPVITVMLPDED